MRMFLAAALLGTACSGDGTEPTDDTTTAPCTSEERDCDGVCFGSAVEDDCGRCDDDPSNDCLQFVVVNGSWTCDPGVTCQDVWEVDLPGASDVTVQVREVNGDSLVRLGAYAPGSRADGVNVLVGSNKDLACWDADADAEATFRAPERGTWRIAVGRDDAGSDGMFGSYTLEVSSKSGVAMETSPFQDDVEARSVGTRCGSEFAFESGWQCGAKESCQDSFEVELESGTWLDLGITDVGPDSVAALGLYAPGDASGDVNLLTNSRSERVCSPKQGADTAALPFEILRSGTYTVTSTRWAPDSSGDNGRYTLRIGADAFFAKPVPDNQDVRTGAARAQCAWGWDQSGGWTCGTGESCQDVYDLELLAGTRLAVSLRNVTGSSVVRTALFPPGQKLSGTNAYTDDTTDWSCGAANEGAVPPEYTVPADGVYQLAVGRDADGSVGPMGDYDLQIEVRDGYGRAAGGALDDVLSEATGVECP